MTQAKIGSMYKLKDKRQRYYHGPAQYQNDVEVLTSILDNIQGGLYFEQGLCGACYWNIEDVKEVQL